MILTTEEERAAWRAPGTTSSELASRYWFVTRARLDAALLEG